MKNLYKIFLSFVVIIILNIVIQTPSYSHGLQSILSTISFFSNANASLRQENQEWFHIINPIFNARAFLFKF